MLYTLNIYSDVCQLFLNKTGKKSLQKVFGFSPNSYTLIL